MSVQCSHVILSLICTGRGGRGGRGGFTPRGGRGFSSRGGGGRGFRGGGGRGVCVNYFVL